MSDFNADDLAPERSPPRELDDAVIAKVAKSLRITPDVARTVLDAEPDPALRSDRARELIKLGARAVRTLLISG